MWITPSVYIYSRGPRVIPSWSGRHGPGTSPVPYTRSHPLTPTEVTPTL